MLTAAVVGLGQAGSRFDEEARPTVWSHAGAYLAAADTYRLVGGADVDEGNRARFAIRCPDATLFADAADMAAHLTPDVISVCTPPDGRAALVDRILAVHRPRVLICEKPLEVAAAARRRLVETCGKAGVALMANYNRRYATAYRKAREAIVAGRLGTITSITVLAGNRLWSMGSHAVDTLLYLAGQMPERWRAIALPALDEGGELAGDLLCCFADGTAGRVVTAGMRDILVFEVDVMGREARLRVREPEARATLARFTVSHRYSGYRVLGPERALHRSTEAESTLVALVGQAAGVARGQARPDCSGQDARASEDLLEAMVRACKEDRAA